MIPRADRHYPLRVVHRMGATADGAAAALLRCGHVAVAPRVTPGGKARCERCFLHRPPDVERDDGGALPNPRDNA